MNTTLKTFAIAALATTMVAANATPNTNAKNFDKKADADCFVNACSDVFKAEARIGDAGACDSVDQIWELGIGGGSGSRTQTKNFDWTSGQKVNFSAEYNASSRRVTFKVAGEILTYDIPASKGITGLVLNSYSTNCNSIKLDNLVLSNSPLNKTLISQNHDQSFLAIKNMPTQENWKLTGKVQMNWKGATQANSAGFSMRGVEACPEPASMLAMVMGAAGIFARKRRNK